MAKTASIYRKVTRRHRSLLGYSQLWLAEDHLLLLKSARFTEEYHRFALADIQALVVTELRSRQVVDFIILLTALLWTGLSAVVSSGFGQGFFIVTGVGFLTVAIINLARGARCTCYLHTAVSKELLTPLSRMKNARQFLSRIVPAIEGVQGALMPEQQIVQVSSAFAPPPTIPEVRGYGMELLFGLLLLDAVFIPLARRFPRIGEESSSALLITTFVAEAALAIMVLIRNQPAASPLRQAARALAGLALICMIADAVGIGTAAVEWVQQLITMSQRRDPVVPGFDWPATIGWLYFAVGWRVLVGLAGFVSARLPEPVRQLPQQETGGADERAA